MSLSQRLQLELITTDVPIWCGSAHGVRTIHSRDTTHASTLASRLADAISYRKQLDACITAMARVLDEGETVEENAARIAAEDADPQAAATRMGWYRIEDFAQLCDKSETGFYNRIANCRGQIVKPDAAAVPHLLGTKWKKYPERSEFWGDYFRFAETWEEALRRARVDETEARRKGVK